MLQGCNCADSISILLSGLRHRFNGLQAAQSGVQLLVQFFKITPEKFVQRLPLQACSGNDEGRLGVERVVRADDNVTLL